MVNLKKWDEEEIKEAIHMAKRGSSSDMQILRQIVPQEKLKMHPYTLYIFKYVLIKQYMTIIVFRNHTDRSHSM